jgi:hypothetical protein
MKALVGGAGGAKPLDREGVASTGPRGRSDDDSVGRVGGDPEPEPEGAGGAAGPKEGDGGCSGAHRGCGSDQIVRPAEKWSLSTAASASAYRAPVR